MKIISFLDNGAVHVGIYWPSGYIGGKYYSPDTPMAKKIRQTVVVGTGNRRYE